MTLPHHDSRISFQDALDQNIVFFKVKKILVDGIDDFSSQSDGAFTGVDCMKSISTGKRVEFVIAPNIIGMKGLYPNLCFEAPFSRFLAQQYLESVVDGFSLSSTTISKDCYVDEFKKVINDHAYKILSTYPQYMRDCSLWVKIKNAPSLKLSPKYEAHREIMKGVSSPHFESIKDGVFDNIHVTLDIPEYFEIINDFPKDDLYFAKIPSVIYLNDNTKDSNLFDIEKINPDDIRFFSSYKVGNHKYRFTYEFYSTMKKGWVVTNDIKTDDNGVRYIGGNNGYYLYSSKESALKSIDASHKSLKDIVNNIDFPTLIKDM